MSLTSNTSCQKEGTGSRLLPAQQLPNVLSVIHKRINTEIEKNSSGLFALVSKHQYPGFLKDLSWMQLHMERAGSPPSTARCLREGSCRTQLCFPEDVTASSRENEAGSQNSTKKMTTKLNPKGPKKKLCRFVLKGHREGKRPELRDPSTAAAQSIIPTSLNNVDFMECGSISQFHGSTR